jgi:hypothetical protein
VVVVGGVVVMMIMLLLLLLLPLWLSSTSSSSSSSSSLSWFRLARVPRAPARTHTHARALAHARPHARTQAYVVDSNPATCEVVAVPGDLPDQFSTEPHNSDAGAGAGAASGAETSGAESDSGNVVGGGDDGNDDDGDDRAGGGGGGGGGGGEPPKNVLAPGTTWLDRVANMRAAMSACHPYMRCVQGALSVNTCVPESAYLSVCARAYLCMDERACPRLCACL